MSARRLVAVSLVSAVLFGTTALAGPDPDPASVATAAWRAKREADLRSPDGWLSVAGLFFLKPGPNSIGADPASDIVLPAGSAPAEAGTITYRDGRIWVDLKPGVVARVKDQPVNGRTELRQADDEQDRPADRLMLGRLILHPHRSGDRVGIRLRDPESPLRKSFAGLQWFPIDSAWRLIGRFVPYDAPRTMIIQNVLGDADEFISPGEVEVVSNGAPIRIVPVKDGTRLWFILTDETATRGETYKIRFLYADMPNEKNEILLDFNRTYNPPCAYNPHTTCPLPPSQNRLKIPIRAGEKAYVGPSPHS